MSGKDSQKPDTVRAIERRESLVFPDIYRTFENLQDPYSKERRLVGREILERIIDDPSTKRVVVLGLPGIGKTVITHQLANLLENNGVEVELVHFDNYYQQFCQKIGKTPSEWDENDHRQFSQEFSQEVIRRETNPKKKILIETPFALPQLVKDSLFIAVAGDTRTQERSWHLRIHVERLQELPETEEISWIGPSGKRETIKISQVPKILEEAYNFRIFWLNTNLPENNTEKGKFLIETLKKSAPQRGIQFCRQTAFQFAEESLRAQGLTEADLPPLPPLPTTSRPLLNEEDVWCQKFIYYTQGVIDELVERDGLPRDKGIVILNPYSDDTVYWFF